MRILNIKDNYMFDKTNKTGTHRYAVYRDNKTYETRAIQLTHIYEIPPNKQSRINNGYIKELKLPFYYLPSGIETGYITKDINGKKLKLNNGNSNVSVKRVDDKSKNSILRIAKKKLK
ncbi:MAG: hypothetical protein LBV51_04130 [Acholeplasmatales bacterium]|jgi:hypothetical protein|nr:hypothetical protein [Acholeplasmatales bacterium]